MSSQPPESDREQRFQEVLAGYLQAVEVGQAPPQQAFLAHHPQFAPELASFFANWEEFRRLARATTDTPTVGPEEASPSSTGARICYFGDYELLEEIARGGMGVVYKARQVSLNRIVALKMILAGEFASANDVQRFRTEAEAAANLDHPHIVPIYEVGEHAGAQYFSMKLIEGEPLAQATARERGAGGHVEARQTAELLATVARAVHYAHQHGLLHRDLKPANILLDRSTGDPYVTDFGLAKRVIDRESKPALTHTGSIL